MIVQIPSRSEPKKIWVKKIRRKDWLPSSNSRLCSDYFSESCFDRAGKIIKLKKDAIPTRFKSFPKHMQEVTYPSPRPSIRINVSFIDSFSSYNLQYKICASATKLMATNHMLLMNFKVCANWTKLLLGVFFGFRGSPDINQHVSNAFCITNQHQICHSLLNSIVIPLFFQPMVSNLRKQNAFPI